MLLRTGHGTTGCTVHLTHTSLVQDALCGEDVSYHGEPDQPVICQSCERIASDLGEQPDAWPNPGARILVALRQAA
jgi:hypothetical protein